MNNVIIDTNLFTFYDYKELQPAIIKNGYNNELYEIKYEDGSESILTRQELKNHMIDREHSSLCSKLEASITLNRIDEAFENLNHLKYSEFYTDDGMNFMDEFEYERIIEEYPDSAEDFYRVEFIILQEGVDYMSKKKIRNVGFRCTEEEYQVLKGINKQVSKAIRALLAERKERLYGTEKEDSNTCG